ncbi:MAG: hypothetical protein RBQ97_05160 [Acholeplasma sp.]|nr:hypothetical protein [Acholeplasma sp.]
MQLKEGFIKDTLRFFKNSLPLSLRKKRKYMRIYRDVLKHLHESQYYDSTEIKKRQLNELQKIVDYSYNNVPYYKTLFDNIGLSPSDIKSLDDIVKIPYITKEIIVKEGDKLLSNQYKKNKLTMVQTGGTTGTPVKFYFEPTQHDAINDAYVDFIYSRIGYKKNESVVIFRDNPIINKNIKVENNVYWKKNPGTKQLWFSVYFLTNKYFPLYFEKIKNHNPKWIISYPHALYNICRYIKESSNNPFKSLKGIIFMSENIYPHQKKLFDEVFPSIPKLSVYGHTEMGCIAGTCEQSFKYHIQHEFGISEFLDSDFGMHELVTTGFHNYAMPLLRYKTSDLFKISNSKCNCERGYMLIDDIEGRLQGLLYTFDDRPISDNSLDFPDSLEDVFAFVEKYQFVQEINGLCDLNVVPREGFTEDHKKRLEMEISKKFQNGIIVHVKCVDSIPKTAHGKERLVIQHMKKF